MHFESAPRRLRAHLIRGRYGRVAVDFSSDGGKQLAASNLAMTRENMASANGRSTSACPSKDRRCSWSAAQTATARANPTRPIGIRGGSCATSSSKRSRRYLRREDDVPPGIGGAFIAVIALRVAQRPRRGEVIAESVNIDLPTGDRHVDGRAAMYSIAIALPATPRDGGSPAADVEGTMARRGRQDAHRLQAPIDPKDVDTMSTTSSASGSE